ncbi:hypothetical protein [Streptomyces vilmorinianum]|uniref:hypothetical protein n=1 Tax=Streptomyces vilmorinianum TaxID=3051092 RepID=UPI001586EC7A|nr:hypothetical protein [Streptomyces vilmorinianum]
MTTITLPTTAPAPLTVRSFLLGEGASTEGPLRENRTADTALGRTRRMTPAADRAVEHELATVVDDFLGLDLLDLAVGGWRRHTAFQAAARRTRDFPGSEEVVALADHRVTSSHRPYVDVYLDGAKVGTLEVALTLVFRIAGLICVVRDAHLTGVRSGQCALDASLALQGAPLAERKGGQINLPGAFALRAPVPLLQAEPPPPPPPPPGSPPPPPPAAPGLSSR